MSFIEWLCKRAKHYGADNGALEYICTFGGTNLGKTAGEASNIVAQYAITRFAKSCAQWELSKHVNYLYTGLDQPVIISAEPDDLIKSEMLL